MIEEVISKEVDLLDVECEPVQALERDNKQIDIDNYDTPSTSKKLK